MTANGQRVGIERMDRPAWLVVAAALIPIVFVYPKILLAFGAPVALLAWMLRGGRPLDRDLDSKISFIFVLTSVLDFLVGSRDAVLAFACFFASIMAISIFFGRGYQSLRQVYLLAFLLMLVTATRTLELGFLLFMFVFCASALFCYVREAHPVVTQRRSYLWAVLLFSLASFLCSLPIFFILPRMPFVLFDVSNLASLTGFSDNVTLGDMARIKKSNKLFMRVYANQERRWRGQVLDHYENKRWTSRATQGLSRTLETRPGVPVKLLSRDQTPIESLFQQEFILEPYMNRTIFGASQVRQVDLPGYPLVHGAGDQLSRGGDIRYQKIAYRAWSRLPQASTQQLRAARGPLDTAHSMKAYLQLPEGMLRVRELAAQVAGRHPSWYDKAAALEKFLMDNYKYTLNLPDTGALDPIEAFLFDTKRGHCEYFASVMTIMLRMQGVPARVITGFASGEFNQYGGYYTVKEKDAHAWVEAYLPGVGWWEFDPTPGSDEAEEQDLFDMLGLSKTQLWLQMNAWIDSLDAQWQRDVVSYSADGQRDLMTRIAETAWESWMQVERAFTRARIWVRQRRAPLAGGLVALLALSMLGGRKRVTAIVLWLLELVKVSRARGAGRKSVNPLELAPFYARLMRALAARGVPRQPDWTPIEYARRVIAERPEVADPLLSLTDLYCRIVFAAHEPSEADFASADRWLAELDRLLRQPAKSRH